MIIMKHQQVTVDFLGMVFTACSYLALAGAVWIFLRLLQACFWLPRHLKKQNDVQQMLQEKVDSYEKYILECEEKEKNMLAEGNFDETVPDKETYAERWKERRECLEMLKKELNRVQEGGDMYDWEHLLEEEGLKLDGTKITEVENDEDEKKSDEDKKDTDDNVKQTENENAKNSKNSKSTENTEDEAEEDESDAEAKKDK